MVTFKNKKSERSLLNVNPEEARAAWEMLYGKDALKDGDGTPILGLEQGGGSYHEIGKTSVRRTARRDVIVHPALLDTELAAAGIRVELLANNRDWIHAELDADASLGAKDSHARAAMKQMVEWAFDPWRNLDVFFRRQRLSVFRLVDVPLVVKPGVQDAALRVIARRRGVRRAAALAGVHLDAAARATDEGRQLAEGRRAGGEEVREGVVRRHGRPAEGVAGTAAAEQLRGRARRGALGEVEGGDVRRAAEAKGRARTPESLAVFSDLVVQQYVLGTSRCT